MAKPSEIKLAADIIRRILDAAERGEIDYLQYMKLVSRRRAGEVKEPAAKEESRETSRKEGGLTQEFILQEINHFDNENELGEYLRDKYPTRVDIVSIARALRVPSPKTDDYDAIIGRVIDATLGYKMRSQAVRGSASTRGRREFEDK